MKKQIKKEKYEFPRLVILNLSANKCLTADGSVTDPGDYGGIELPDDNW